MAPRKNNDFASSIIVQDVIEGLYEGRYVAGQRLAERDLIEHYGLSRSSVREALNQMSAEGIVEWQSYRGARIRKLTRRDAENTLFIIEFILGLASRQAAAHIDEGDAREQLRASFESIEEFTDDNDHLKFIRRNEQYFFTLIKINGNRELRRLLPRLQVHLVRNRQSVPMEAQVQGYREITEAILAGDEEAAESAARRYVRMTVPYLLPHFPE